MQRVVSMHQSDGSEIPDCKVLYGHPPVEVELKARAAGKKIIIVGLPGAFTPC